MSYIPESCFEWMISETLVVAWAEIQCPLCWAGTGDECLRKGMGLPWWSSLPCRGPGSIPGWGTRIPYPVWCGQNLKGKNKQTGDDAAFGQPANSHQSLSLLHCWHDRWPQVYGGQVPSTHSKIWDTKSPLQSRAETISAKLCGLGLGLSHTSSWMGSEISLHSACWVVCSPGGHIISFPSHTGSFSHWLVSPTRDTPSFFLIVFPHELKRSLRPQHEWLPGMGTHL